MARLYPFSSETVALLTVAPEAGETHLWLARVSARLKGELSHDACFAYLRDCVDRYVQHRAIPDREIESAVSLGYSDEPRKANHGLGALQWPEASREVIEQVIAGVTPMFDGVSDTGLEAADVLPGIFASGELVCTGVISEKAMVRPLEAAMADARFQQFVCVNPMKGSVSLNANGMPSVRCQNNVKCRRHIVAEFDDSTLTKPMQAALATALNDRAPLVMAVDSGGKSVHAWYRVDGMSAQQQARFFAIACLLGADRTRWDVCGWLRMPGGLRQREGAEPVRQKILYWAGDVATTQWLQRGT